MDTTDADTPHVIAVIQRGDLCLHGTFDLLRSGHFVNDRIHKGQNGIPAAVFQIVCCPAVSSAAVKHGEIQLFVGGVQVDEQVKDLVQHFLRAGVGAVHLIDENNGFQVERQRLLQHKTGLGQGTFRRIHKEQGAVCQIENPFHLTAEVAVTRGVDHVHFCIAVVDADIFGEDGDPAFPFQVVVIEEALVHFLIFAEKFGLFDDLVHERGLAVVNVCNDGDVTNLHKYFLRCG